MSSEKLLPWARPLLLSSTLTQATIYVLRPMITYRAIELDANTVQIGVVAALYALFPVLLALQFGSWVGKIGEGKLIIAGTLSLAATAFALLNPRRSINRTAGFRPIAKKREMIIKTKTWLADANARSKVIAMMAPDAARNPK